MEPRDLPESLTTDRLTLRIPKLSDAADIVPAVAQSLPELKPYLPWATDTYGTAEAEDWIRRTLARCVMRECVNYLIFDRETGQLVGGCGTLDINWKVPKTEIGYWLRSDQTRRGYMSEAVCATTAMLFGLGMQRLQIRCNTLNAASAAVARRCGYTLEGTLRRDARDPAGELYDMHVFGLIAP